MTLRTKTRSRKGRDLKRLDGMKRRATRRRMRKQRGGDNSIPTLRDWVAKVASSGIYKDTTVQNPLPTDYRISGVASDYLKLPKLTPDMDATKFELEIPSLQPMDAQSIAALVEKILSEILKLNPSAGAFKGEMEKQLNLAQVSGDSTDTLASLEFLMEVEQALRKLLPSSSEPVVSSEKEIAMREVQQAMPILIDEAKYPLYIWALAYAAPADMEEVPVLKEEEKNKETITALSEQADTMP
jgi:hypothetical protein